MVALLIFTATYKFLTFEPDNAMLTGLIVYYKHYIKYTYMNENKKDHNKCKNAIRSIIRQQFSRSDYYKEFLKSRRVEWKEKRISEVSFKVSYIKRVSYRCEVCDELYGLKEINVDHIKPIGRGVYNGIEDAHKFYKLVYCSYSNLQIICKDKCHAKKTKLENKEGSYDNAEF